MTQSLIYGLWGLVFGVALSAPVGPINIICLRRALFGRAVDGFVIGLGAALGDTVYAVLAAFGLNAVFVLIEAHMVPLKFFSSLVMFAFAVHIWRSHPRLKKEHEVGKVKRTMFGAFLLTVTNPGVFLGFLALYALAGLGVGENGALAFGDALYLSVGVFVGAALWWALLVWGAKAFSEKFNDQLLVKINHVSAIIIAIFAVATVISALLPA